MARESNREIMANVPHQPGTVKRIANNTVRFIDLDGNTVIRLHHTNIITTRPDNTQILNTGGWRTVTTKDRLNSLSRAHIYSERGTWYLAGGSLPVPFFDGCEIGPNGELPPVDPTIPTAQRELRRKIKNFVAKIHAPLPNPSSGDCWLCLFRDKDGHTMGEHDTSHLLSHIEEGYIHGSLIVNALLATGYRKEQLPYVAQHIDLVRRATRRYLSKSLGLAA